MAKISKQKSYKIQEIEATQLSEPYAEYVVMDKSMHGIPIQYLNKISDKYHISTSEWADIMGISSKSIQRYQQQENTLSATQSEFVLKIEHLYVLGKEVFGNIDNFKNWLQKPAYGIGNKVPLKILNTISGINIVINQLMRIAHGDLS